MKTRIIFGIVAGIMGVLIGAGIGFLVQKEGEPFPVYIVVGVALIFMACGALAKRKWLSALEDFILHVLP
jgi:F0F1-type ATP synthase assembly protein I